MFTFLCTILLLAAKSPPPREISPLKSLYNTLDPLSVSEHLAFYELYSDTPEGHESLKVAWQLLSKGAISCKGENTSLPQIDIQNVISLITRQQDSAQIKLTSQQLALIESVSCRLFNRSLKGHALWNKEEILALKSEEIDLSRSLLVFQWEDSPTMREEIAHYEALIDIMALQIAARLPFDPTEEGKISAINDFIFYEMGFRFPPHSLYAKDIDLYTFLPSVLDNRQGVCLGVSILYLCIAQRLGLPLEIITPPGHIYLRYPSDKGLINIETTARGINPPSEIYLGINTRQLQQRTIKEVIGLAFMNQAAVCWEKQEFHTMARLYEKAQLFLPNDPLLKMFLGYNYLLIEKTKEGKKLLKEISTLTFDEAVSRETIPEDYLNGLVNAEGIKTIFLPVDETRESILKKQQELIALLKRFPRFRAGLLHLATTFLQLGRGNEAKEALEKYHKIDPDNSIVEYYLAILSLERLDFNRAWSYLKKTERIVGARDHHPKALDAVRAHLRRQCPDI